MGIVTVFPVGIIARSLDPGGLYEAQALAETPEAPFALNVSAVSLVIDATVPRKVPLLE